MPSYVYVAAQDENQIAVLTIDGATGGLTPQAAGADGGRAVPAGDQPQPALPLCGAPRGPGDLQPSSSTPAPEG